MRAGKSQRKLEISQGGKKAVVAASFIVSLPHGVVADVNRNKQYSLPISSLLTASGITTACVFIWLLRSHESSNL